MMRSTYRVRDWEKNFTTAESRKMKGEARWVPVPTDHGGKRFKRLLRHENGAALYGAWVLILQVSAKCPTKGTLADGDGPLAAEDIADATGAPAELIGEALRVLSDPSQGIRWLERLDPEPDTPPKVNSADNPPGLPGCSPGLPGCVPGPSREPGLQDRTEQNITQQDNTTQNTEEFGISVLNSHAEDSTRNKQSETRSVFNWLPVELFDKQQHDTSYIVETLRDWQQRVSKAKRPLVSAGDDDLLFLLAAYTHAKRTGNEPRWLFCSTVGKAKRDDPSERDYARARLMIATYKQHLDKTDDPLAALTANIGRGGEHAA